MNFILVVILSTFLHGGQVSVVAEFNSLQSCEKAKDRIISKFGFVHFAECLPK